MVPQPTLVSAHRGEVEPTLRRERLKLHLGCGKRCLPGFVHVDLADFPHIEHRRAVDRLDIFEDGAAELIYASHVLEYFDRQEAPRLLAEWRRVLCPGGGLRLAVPDFVALVEVYFERRNLDLILGPLYGRMEIAGSSTVVYHKTVYEFASLKKLLEESGFAGVHRYDWRETIHRDHDDHSQAYIPHMDKEHGKLISLNVECIKPPSKKTT
jgi:predicted SAM-dependent methyltransferase